MVSHPNPPRNQDRRASASHVASRHAGNCICLERRSTVEVADAEAPEPGPSIRPLAAPRSGKYQALMLFREPVGSRTRHSRIFLPYRGRTTPARHSSFIVKCLCRCRWAGFVRRCVEVSRDERFFHETRILGCGGFLLARWRVSARPSYIQSPGAQSTHRTCSRIHPSGKAPTATMRSAGAPCESARPKRLLTGTDGFSCSWRRGLNASRIVPASCRVCRSPSSCQIVTHEAIRRGDHGGGHQ